MAKQEQGITKVGFVEVGGEEYQIIKTGRGQAKQVIDFTKWLTRHAIPAIEQARGDKKDLDASSGLEFLGELLEYLDADALIDLFVALIGCSVEVAEVHFDVSILIDVAMDVYNGQPSVRRLIDRFFSSTSTEETKPEESSTTSE